MSAIWVFLVAVKNVLILLEATIVTVTMATCWAVTITHVQVIQQLKSCRSI